MTIGDAAGASSSSPSSSSKRLSYVPYQRKGHQRNASGASQISTFSPESEPKLVRPTSESASASTRPNTDSNSSESGGLKPRIETSTRDRLPTSSTPLRSQSTLSRTGSTLSRPAIASPLAQVAGILRPNHDLDAPPPPLRVASKLDAGKPQSTNTAATSNRVSSSISRAQPSTGSSASQQFTAISHGRSASTASTSTVHAIEPPCSPQKQPETPRTSRGLQHSRTTSVAGQSSANGANAGSVSCDGGTNKDFSAASSVPGSSRASSNVGSPLGSRSSTPIVGASGTSIPAHVNSYAALLAAQTKLGPIPVPQGVALAQAAGSNSSSQQMALPTSDGRATAYRSGFQPKGVLRLRTPEFVELRRKGRSEGEMQAQRMDRRLAKLNAIHFAPINDTEKSPNSSKKSSFIDLDLDELKRDPSSIIRKGGNELWTSFRARGRGVDPAIRQAEQSIVNWQDDAEAKACPICSTPFSFTVRKHHCRLCGRVVCASPHLIRLAWADQVGPGTTGKTLTTEERAALDAKCSGNIVADPISGRITEVKEGVPTPQTKAGSSSAPSKGVRICLDCKSIVRKRQYMMNDEPLPVFIKLYQALMRVQKEIEQSLPEFQEMVLGLQKQDQTAALGSSIRANIELQRDAVQARKQLLANFATYDELAKRIRALPVGDKCNAVGHSDAAQERIQHAIFTRANLFLQQNMLPLQSLPKPGSRKTSKEDGGSDSTGSTPSSPGPASPRIAPRRGGGGGQHANKGSISSLASIRSLFGGGAGSVRSNAPAGLDEGLDTDDVDQDGETDKATPEELKEQLKVLLEQEKLVADYVESAAKARKFEDAKMLKKSHDELCKEILRIQRRLVVSGKGR
ncbi:related to vacuolar segregation protein PEP7 [Melanopsichium pennsylvanicum]|uniref:Related to vacuolar segregation protein PEP7 n=2 Tax=Melanopsichium pennsylvanicum TaxID=63383 RepID=A0AAJ5C3H7_9BASI|nr:related to vacuolar segregation protein PEP7 [Melanopsichium pennsylvanicum 4]SNX82607.1 related to vacuolar segregation protein PEP7 [Melanopsichium pennsylvanicum]